MTRYRCMDSPVKEDIGKVVEVYPPMDIQMCVTKHKGKFWWGFGVIGQEDIGWEIIPQSLYDEIMNHAPGYIFFEESAKGLPFLDDDESEEE